MLLKIKQDLQKWYTFYAEAIMNRLRVDMNLSDVKDVQAARDNLGINGDNNHTHYHDDRYVPLINKVDARVTQEIMDRATTVSSEADARKTADDELSKKLAKEISDREASEKVINDRIAALEKKVADIFDGNGHLVFPNQDTLWLE